MFTTIMSPEIIREINMNFVLRWWNNDDPRQTKLVGAGKYSKLVGEDLAKKHFDKALNRGAQDYVFKLRRGITVKFCSK